MAGIAYPVHQPTQSFSLPITNIMRKSDILIALIWVLLIFDCLSKGLSISDSPMTTGLSWGDQKYVVWLFPFAFFLPAVFLQRKSALKIKFLANIIDKRLGAGTLDNFVYRLRPTVLFMMASLTLGVSGLITTFFNNGPDGAYTVSRFFVSCGLGIFTAYVLSLKFPPVVR